MAYTTVASVKAYLKIPSNVTVDDTLIQEFIDDACGFIDGETDRKFEAPSDTTFKFDAVTYQSYLNAFRYASPTYYDYYDWRVLWFDKYDCRQITQVINGDGTIVSANDYVTLPINAAALNSPMFGIRLKLNSNIVWTWDDTPDACIQVTGRWAYSITPPRDIQMCAKLLAARLYKQKDNNMPLQLPQTRRDGQIASQNIASDIMGILEGYRRIV